MKIAYLILAHNNLDHLALLINSLNNSSISFIIHLDSKTDVDFNELSKKFQSGINLIFLKNRINISWGGFSMFEAILNLISHAVQYVEFDYLSLISGNDFPLKKPEEILSDLKKFNGKEFIDYHPLPHIQWPGNGGTDRYKYYWMIDNLGWENSEYFVYQQQIQQSVREFPSNLKPYGGSMWFTITKSCSVFIYSFLMQNPSILSFFRYTLISDELIIPTIVLNSPFKYNTVRDNLRFIDWSEGKMHPKTFTISDFESLARSNAHLARKFDSALDQGIIDKLIRKLEF